MKMTWVMLAGWVLSTSTLGQSTGEALPEVSRAESAFARELPLIDTEAMAERIRTVLGEGWSSEYRPFLETSSVARGTVTRLTRSDSERAASHIDTSKCQWLTRETPDLPPEIATRLARSERRHVANPSLSGELCTGLMSCRHRILDAQVYLMGTCMMSSCSNAAACARDRTSLTWLTRQSDAARARPVESAPRTVTAPAAETTPPTGDASH